MTNKIHLPLWVQPMAELHAQCVVEDEMGLSEDDPKYEKMFEKAFMNFCSEFYKNSLIPHAANPTIPAGKNVFEIFEGDYKSSLKTETPEQSKELYSQITRSVSMISRVLVNSEMGIMKYDLKDVQGNSKEEKTNKYHDSIRNRYKRMVYICIMMGLIKSMFKIKKSDLDSFVDDLLKSKKWRSLQSTKATKDFATKIKKAIEEDVESFDPIGKLKEVFKE